MPVVGAAPDVLVEQPLQLGAAEEPAVLAAEQQVGRERPQLLAGPAGERHAEAGLAAAGDLERQVALEGLPEQPLAGVEGERQAEPELHHTVVEERWQEGVPEGVVLETVRPGYRTARRVVVCKAGVIANRRP